MATALSVCVFCGFSPGNDDAYVECGRQLGALLGEHGHRLVYGAGMHGLMGAVAAEAAAAGAEITGVVPEFLRVREQADELPEQELVLTGDLFERKRVMIAQADGFIALPGGYGTLDEVVEVISMVALGVIDAPIVLIDVDGYWLPFVDLVEEMRDRGFLRDTSLFTVADSPAAALAHLEHAAASTPPALTA